LATFRNSAESSNERSLNFESTKIEGKQWRNSYIHHSGADIHWSPPFGGYTEHVTTVKIAAETDFHITTKLPSASNRLAEQTATALSTLVDHMVVQTVEWPNGSC
jgi:hypothetical protein